MIRELHCSNEDDPGWGPRSELQKSMQGDQGHGVEEALFVDGYIKRLTPQYPIKDRIVKSDEK